MRICTKIVPAPSGKFLWVLYDCYGAVYVTGRANTQSQARLLARTAKTTIKLQPA